MPKRKKKPALYPSLNAQLTIKEILEMKIPESIKNLPMENWILLNAVAPFSWYAKHRRIIDTYNYCVEQGYLSNPCACEMFKDKGIPSVWVKPCQESLNTPTAILQHFKAAITGIKRPY